MKSKRSRLIKNLDKYFSQYIRIKYSKKGICTCISCGKVDHYKKMHNCHWISRGKFWTRWDEDNCRPGCPGCNTYRAEFHMREFTLKQLDRLGREKCDEMIASSYKIKNRKIHELEAMLDYYKAEVKELMKKKG